MEHIKSYEELSPEQQEKLAVAWAHICEGLQAYAEVTGAENLDNIVYDSLWEAINFQRSEQESEHTYPQEE